MSLPLSPSSHYRAGRRLILRFGAGELARLDEICFVGRSGLEPGRWLDYRNPESSEADETASLDNRLPRALAKLFIQYAIWRALGKNEDQFQFVENVDAVIKLINACDTPRKNFSQVFKDPDKPGKSCFKKILDCPSRRSIEHGENPLIYAKIHSLFLPADCVEIYWDIYPTINGILELEHLVKLLGALTHTVQGAAPTNLSGLVGRSEEIENILALLRQGERLITVHAAPGIGKSTLLTAIEERLKQSHELDCFPVSLEDKDRLVSLRNKIAAKLLGSNRRGPDNGYDDDDITRLLKEKGRCLLILDNFQRAVDFTSMQARFERWQKEAPRFLCLIGSQRLLGLGRRHEHPYRLLPLAAPRHAEINSSSAEELMKYPALELFKNLTANEAVHQLDPRNTEDVRAAAKICAAFRGWPMAIRNECGKLDRYSIVQVARAVEQLPERKELGEGEDWLQVKKQLEYLFEKLTPVEKVCLMQASQFRGGARKGINSEAFQPVWFGDRNCPIANFGKPPVGGERLDSVSTILDKLKQCFLTPLAVHSRSGATSYRWIFNAAMESWLEKKWLTEMVGKQAWFKEHNSRFHRCFVQLFRSYNDRLTTKDRLEALDAMLDEHENLFTALENAGVPIPGRAKPPMRVSPSPARAVEIVQVLAPGMRILGPAKLFDKILEKTMLLADRIATPAQKAFILRHRSEANWKFNKWSVVHALAEESMKLARPLGNHPVRCDTEQWYLRTLVDHKHRNLPEIQKKIGDLEEIAATVLRNEDSKENLSMLAEIKVLHARVHDDMGSFDAAIKKLEELDNIIDELDAHTAAQLLNRKGLTLWRDGQALRAAKIFEEAGAINESMHDDLWRAGAKTNLGFALMDVKNPDFAEVDRVLEQAETLHLRAENPAWEKINRVAQARLLLRRGDFDEADNFLQDHAAEIRSNEDAQNHALLKAIWGVVKARQERFAEAIVDLEEVANTYEDSGKLLLRHFAVRVVAADCCRHLKRMPQMGHHLKVAKEIVTARRISLAHPAPYIVEHFRDYTALQNELAANESPA